LNQEHVDFAHIVRSEDEVHGALPLPDVPLVVIRHGVAFSTDPGWPTKAVERLWLGLQRSLARETSPAGQLVLAAKSGHRIAEQQPAVVAAAIERVLAKARH
jgi:pimeloyl-ACP methyl ester carboxylesterase